MIVLAIDTSGAGCFAGVYDAVGEVLLSRAGADIGRGHAERLMAFIDEALLGSSLALQDIDRLAVCVGPGSFTGIRVGVAAARGLALALGVPAVGISTLSAEALASFEVAPGKPVLVAIDGRREDVYCQTFDADGQAEREAAVLSLEDAQRLASSFHGIVRGSGARLIGDRDTGDAGFDIRHIAQLGAQAPIDGRPKPLYLRGADAKPQAGFAIARA